MQGYFTRASLQMLSHCIDIQARSYCFSMASFLPRTKSAFMLLLQKLIKLNLFIDPQNQQLVHEQILSTRLYLVLLSITLLFLTLFNALTPISTHIIVLKPPLETYLRLESKHSNTLSCPCQQSAISYSTFFSIQPVFHTVRLSADVA